MLAITCICIHVGPNGIPQQEINLLGFDLKLRIMRIVHIGHSCMYFDINMI